MAIARAVSGLGRHDRAGDKEIGQKGRCERRDETERREAVRWWKGESRKKIGGAEEGAREGSLARQERIFEYDYTARVNRPVRKRAASYTRNAFACPMVGE